MYYITEEHYKIFDKEAELLKKREEARKKWHDEVDRSKRGEISHDDTYPQFKEYMIAYDEWEEFSNEHKSILSARIFLKN